MNWDKILKIVGVSAIITFIIFIVGYTMVDIKLDKAFESKLIAIELKVQELNLIAEDIKLKLIRAVQPRTRLLQVTGYSPRVQECDSTPFINAFNKRVRPGTVAVSPDLFRKGWVFGRKVYIKGYGVFEIEDLMNKRHTDRMDIFMWNTQKAIGFGNKHIEVTLLGN